MISPGIIIAFSNVLPYFDADPGSPDCTSCGFKNDPRVQNDARCKENDGFYGKNEDDMNVRFHKMKKRFGVDPQYPIKRYVDGLTKSQVPDRKSEHDANGNYIPDCDVRNLQPNGECGPMSNVNFGKALATRFAPRQLQLGLKIVF